MTRPLTDADLRAVLEAMRPDDTSTPVICEDNLDAGLRALDALSSGGSRSTKSSADSTEQTFGSGGGECETCRGTGDGKRSTNEDGTYRPIDCPDCHGTGREPASQAIRGGYRVGKTDSEGPCQTTRSDATPAESPSPAGADAVTTATSGGTDPTITAPTLGQAMEALREASRDYQPHRGGNRRFNALLGSAERCVAAWDSPALRAAVEEMDASSWKGPDIGRDDAIHRYRMLRDAARALLALIGRGGSDAR